MSTYAATRPGVRIPWRIGAAASIVLVVGFMIGRATSLHGAAQPVPGRVAAPSTPPPPAAATEHSSQGATTAALAALTQLANGLLTETPSQLAALYVPSRRVEAAAGLQRAAEYMRSLNGASTTARSVPIGYHVESYTDAEAKVTVWAVGVSGGNVTGVAGVWQTSTITLAWTDTRWLVADSTETVGPAPIPSNTPTDSQGVLSVLKTMEVPRALP